MRLEPESVIHKLEDERCNAMALADVGALSDLLDPDLIWTHSSGHVDGRATFFAKLTGGEVRYERIDRNDEVVRVFAGCAVVTGRAAMEVTIGGARHDLSNRFTNVWIKRPEGWRMIAWQSTKAGDHSS